MGRGTEPEVPVPAPIFQVVAALLPRPGEVGDLVVAVPRGPQGFPRRRVHPRDGVVVGQGDPAAADRRVDRRAGFRRQRVGRHVVGQEGHGEVEVLLPFRLALAGVPEDEVDPHGGEPRPARVPVRRADVLHGVDPPEGGEGFRPERLDPEAHAVEAALPQPGEIVAGHRSRVRLRRDLGVFRHGKARPDRGEEPVETVRPEDRRRPPAEVHGVRRDARFAGERPQEEVHLPLHERGKPVALLLPAGDGVEVAIPALADAERNVNVDPAHRPILPRTLTRRPK